MSGMAKSTDIRIRRANCSTQQIAYRTPMKFGGRVVTDVVLLDVEVEVEADNGKSAVGFGSMPLGNIWAWPGQSVAAADTLTAMRLLGETLVVRANQSRHAGHPLQITTQLAAEHDGASKDATNQAGVAEPIPRLAQLVAASPLEAAIYDAFGKVHEHNAYNLLGEELVEQDLSHWLGDDFRGEWLDRYTLRQPKPTMPLYHLVGALDPLTDSDVDTPIAVVQYQDGETETIRIINAEDIPAE